MHKYAIPATKAEARNLARLLRLVARFPDERVDELITEADEVFLRQMADRAETMIAIPKEKSDAHDQ